MKILVVSDNHGDEYILEEISSIYEGEIDKWIHCGDSELSEVHPLWQQFTVVKGNMDMSQNLDLTQIDKMNGTAIFVTHGHRFGVNQSRIQVAKEAQGIDAPLAFYGHTHIPRVEKIDDVFVINPGSVSQPRGGYKIGSYCIVEWNDDVKQVTYYTRNHDQIDELSQELV